MSPDAGETGDLLLLAEDDGWDGPNLAACDYYQGVGSCTFGCREEPSCMTDEPDGGWPPLVRHPCAEQGLRARRLQKRTRDWLGWLVWRPYPDHLKTYVSKYGYHAPTRHDLLRWMNTPEDQRAGFLTAEQFGGHSVGGDR